MTERRQRRTKDVLWLQLNWFVGLRWMAGLAVVLGAVAEGKWLHWYGNAGQIGGIGGVILGYNSVLWLLLRRLREGSRSGVLLLVLAWAQLLLDLACLTALTVLTGGIASPLLGLYVLHMVFASLLLPRLMAYASASSAMLLLSAGLWLTQQWPVEQRDRVAMLGWVVTLLLTVWLANGITRSLRRQRRRLLSQNRRIRAMSRTLRRQQQGMIQQEKMAAAGQMAAGVAHEIANPLASMDGLLQLMERRPEKMRPEAVQTLREQIGRISEIVRRMNRFAHPGDGQWQAGSVNEVVEKALEVIRFDPRIRKVEIEREMGAEAAPTRMMPDALQQVVINLIINALDAMEDVARPRLVVRTSGAQGWNLIEIIDNGHGIRPEDQRRLFEPFFTTKPVGKGTGLGLSISYNLVRQHGGEIEVESREGAGAKFRVRLPAGASEPVGAK